MHKPKYDLVGSCLVRDKRQELLLFGIYEVDGLQKLCKNRYHYCCYCYYQLL